MAGVSIRLDGRDQALSALGTIASRVENARGLWDDIGASLVVSTQRRFAAGFGPDGSPWPPSIRALMQGGKTLIDTARLVQSLTHNASDSGVEVGTNVLYAAIHQFGGTTRAHEIRPKRKKALAFGGRVYAKVKHPGSNIPARPFLGLDDEDEREILAIAEDWLLPGGSDAR